MEGKYHQELHEAVREYAEHIKAGTNQEKLLRRAYISMVLATDFHELTPWDRESHARNLELLAAERRRTLEKEYSQKTLAWATGRKLKKEMGHIEYIINDCKKIQKKALEDMSQ